MLDPVIKGIGLGLIIAIMIGPVFFFIINTSLKKGFFEASLSAIGVMLSDAFFISIAYFGSSVLLYLDRHEEAAGITGGIVIAAYGLILIFKEARVNAAALELAENKSSPFVYMAKGFMLNSLNPSVLLFWIVVASTIPVKEEFESQETLVFYLCTLGTILGIDLLKAYLANKLKTIITARFLIWLNRIAGSALVIYGLSMVIRVFLKN